MSPSAENLNYMRGERARLAEKTSLGPDPDAWNAASGPERWEAAKRAHKVNKKSSQASYVAMRGDDRKG